MHACVQVHHPLYTNASPHLCTTFCTMCRTVLSVLLPFGATMFNTLGTPAMLRFLLKHMLDQSPIAERLGRNPQVLGGWFVTMSVSIILLYNIMPRTLVSGVLSDACAKGVLIEGLWVDAS